MLELFFTLCIIILMLVSVYFLYYQYRVYQEQKELIYKESKSLKILRAKNLENLRSRFRLTQVKLKA